MNSKIKRICCGVLVAAIVLAIGISQTGTIFASDTVYIDENYTTTGSTGAWSGNGRGKAQIISGDTESYLSFDYVNSDGTDPTYYEYTRSFAQVSSGKLLCSFDIKFSQVFGDENIILKQRESGINKSATRFRRSIYSTIWTYCDGSYTQLGSITPDNWYNVRIIVNLDTKKQHLFIVDKSTGNNVVMLTNSNFNEDVDYINMISIGASSTISIDNFKLLKPDMVGITVSGNPYPKKPQTSGVKNQYNYTAFGLSQTGVPMDLVNSTLSLKEQVQGVTVSNNILYIDSTAPAGPVELVMTSNSDSSINAEYLIDIEN